MKMEALTSGEALSTSQEFQVYQIKNNSMTGEAFYKNLKTRRKKSTAVTVRRTKLIKVS